MNSINNLSGMRTYLIGAMDRVPDGGIVWREYITPYLKALNVSVLNPCNNPMFGVEENHNIREEIQHLKNTGQFDKIRRAYGNIRNADLRCVDISDFVICYIDMDIHMCGSYEEIVTANRQKKPVLIWCKQGKKNVPNWLFFMIPHEHIFNTIDDLLIFLYNVNTSIDTSNLKRWFFLGEHKV